jgi:hypothetical protein
MIKSRKLVAGAVGILSAAALVLGAGLPAANALSKTCGTNSSGKQLVVNQSTAAFATVAGGGLQHSFTNLANGSTFGTGSWTFRANNPGVSTKYSSSAWRSATANYAVNGGVTVDRQTIGCQ